MTALFDRHLSGVTGLQLVDHVHTGGIVPDMTEEAFAEVIANVRKVVGANFGPGADLTLDASTPA